MIITRALPVDAYFRVHLFVVFSSKKRKANMVSLLFLPGALLLAKFTLQVSY